MSMRQRVMSVLTLTGCLVGLVGLPLGWGAHPPTRFCHTAAQCHDLHWPAGTAVPVSPESPPLPVAPWAPSQP